MKAWVIGETGIGEAVGAQLIRNKVNTVVTGPLVDVRRYDLLHEFYRNEGPFNVVIYCAGVTYLRWIDDPQGSAARRNAFDVNCNGFINVISLLAREQTGGKVIAISSDAATRPMRGSIGYCVSKAALDMAIKCAARELGDEWQILGLRPSIIEGTPMTKKLDREIPEFRGWTQERYRAYEKEVLGQGARLRVGMVARFIVNMLDSKLNSGTISNLHP